MKQQHGSDEVVINGLYSKDSYTVTVLPKQLDVVTSQETGHYILSMLCV